MARVTTLARLRRIRQQLEVREHLFQERNSLISQARAEGAAWDEIVEATGLTRQAACNAEQKARRQAR